MSRSALAAGVRYLRNVIASQRHHENSDEQLLHAFVVGRDETAFAALVRRYGPMVEGVCRRVLGHPQDAEDAFQATFLVLAQKASRLRKKTALASFLYGTAYRISLNAKRTAVRRRKHEGSVGALTQLRSPADPAEELSWREVRALVDEEVARLPEKYRSAFILCGLESVSQAEAARRLGLKEGTLSNRLTAARKLLAQRLARRGVELTAVLAASTLGVQPASALSPLLVSTTIQAAMATASGQGTAGLIPVHVAALVKSAASTPIVGKMAMILVLAVGAVAVGAGVVTLREPPTPSAEAPPVVAAKPPDKKPADTITVRGRVLDPDGKPVKGARLYWPRLPNPEMKSEEDLEIPQRAKTDADGRFRFELPRSDIDPALPFALIAAADGYGLDWAELPKGDAPPELTLRLVKDHPIEGRIINTEGKPLAGIRVRALVASKMSPAEVDDFLTAWKQEWREAFGRLKAPQTMLLPQGEKSSQAVTDKDGRFRIRGAGSGRLVQLRLHGAGISKTTLLVVNRAGFDAAPVNKVVQQRTPAKDRLLQQPLLLYGATIEYVAPASRRIEGVVKEAGTGKAVPGFVIQCGTGYGDSIRAVADKEGRYRLENIPKKEQYFLYVQPPSHSSWLPTSAQVQDREGLQPITVDFTVVRGILVKGCIRDRTTGKGVRGHVRWAPLPGNPNVGKPGYGSVRFGGSSSGADGRFQLPIIPGPCVLMVQAYSGERPNGGPPLNPYKQAEFDAKDRERVKLSEDRAGTRYFTIANGSIEFLTILNAVKVIDLAADADTATCDLIVDRGATQTVQIEDAEGKPLMGTIAAGVTASNPNTFPIKDARCTVFALDRKKPRRILFYHVKRQLAGSLLLRGDEKEPPVVRLGQTGSVKGRVLDRDGQPLAGAAIHLSSTDPSARELYRQLHRQAIRTGKDGRFRFEGIVPELKFTLGITQGRTIFVADPRLGDKQVKPGETLDLGDVRVKPSP